MTQSLPFTLEDIRAVVEEAVKRQLAQQHELETRYVSYDELAKVTGIPVRRLKQMRSAKVLTPLAEFGNQVRFELRTALKDLRTKLPKPKRNRDFTPKA